MKPDSNATRLSLLSRARRQDSLAWSELVDLYGPLIAHWCRRCGLDAQQASDGVQEVFAAVARSLSDYRPQRQSGAFRAWLWTITSNKANDLFRRNQRMPQGTGGSTALENIHQVPDSVSLPEHEPTETEQLNQLVGRGLEQVRAEFEPRSWDIFRRSVIDQIPTAIVAQEFCVTPAAVRQVRSRVLRRLRQQLGDLED